MRRFLRAAAVAFVALTIAAVAASWYYAGEIGSEALEIDHSDPEPDLVVAGIGDHTITLQVTAATDLEHGDWRRAGRFGLEWSDGYGTVGEIVELSGREVVRDFTPVNGHPKAGDAVRLDEAAFQGDPLVARGLPFQQVSFESDIGTLGAWRLNGSSGRWAIIVHGRAASRETALRALPAFAGSGLSSLVIDYRNDQGAPSSASGLYDHGQSEWKDLEAAVGYALDQGARHIVLVGYSMGGAIVANFLYRSEVAANVRGVVLDSPMLDFGDVVDFGAARRKLPGLLTWLGKTAASLRYGVSWSDLDYLGRADELAPSILLIHGDADRTVHIRTSDALAAARPDLVTYLRVAGAGHAQSWNANPQAYQRAIVEFLAELGG